MTSKVFWQIFLPIIMIKKPMTLRVLYVTVFSPNQITTPYESLTTGVFFWPELHLATCTLIKCQGFTRLTELCLKLQVIPWVKTEATSIFNRERTNVGRMSLPGGSN